MNALAKIGVLLFIFTISVNEIQASCPNINGRSVWGAKAARSKQSLAQNPPPYVVIHHSDTPPCGTSTKCQERIRNIQYDHMNNRAFKDIGYNFLIGGDGNVYEGRGWGIYGSHVPKYNRRSIGICMIGDFQNTAPPSAQMTALKDLIECGVQNGKIAADYHLIGHRQGKSTNCPGDALYEEIKRMPHWESNPN